MYLSLLKKKIRQDILYLHLPDGTTHTFGDSGREAHWYIHSEKALMRIAANWELEMGQTYMDGAWDTGDHDLRDLIAVLRTNFPVSDRQRYRWYTPLLKLLRNAHKISQSYRDISYHYDVKEEVYRLFLDKEMFYSCAYFTHEDNSLEQAQMDKADHIGRKLMLQPGMSVLDIGCGWGSLAFHLASHFGASVTGITLSREQLRVARAEAEKRGLSDKVKFMLSDYREHTDTYDRIVSVGMLEHVGSENLPAYFRRVQEMLKPEGIAMIHSIGELGVPKPTNPWIAKYIFPGGYIPALSEMSMAVEKSGLMTTDVEALHLHYAHTLKHWYLRFREHRDKILELMGGGEQGERFCRMWEFYLVACEASFAHAKLAVYQYQVAHNHYQVPTTRDYLYPPAQADVSLKRTITG